MSQTTKVAHFDIEYLKFLDSDANVLAPLPEFSKDKALLLKLYRYMVITRTFDQKAIKLQRTGQLGTYPSSLGQEAIYVAIGSSMQKEDVLCPYYRDYGAMLWRGVKMEEILLYWGGDERGSDFTEARQDFPICVPIASQTLHAVGVAFAFSYRKEPRVVVTTIGDGGTSRGDFYEALNVAGTWKLPVVFVINNNQWAISVSRAHQTGAETLAQKGIACGVPGEQVDGNDVFAVKSAVDKAVAKARTGGGPTVIEAITYRMCDHTTADDASRYRSDSEVQGHAKEDPILRFKKWMESQTLWSESDEIALNTEASALVNTAVDNYLKTPVQSFASIMDYMYASLPDAYNAQYTELVGRQTK